MLNDKTLMELSRCVYKNAQDLLDEAQLLFNHNKYARAYTLSHLASEELGKLPTIHSARIKILQSKEIDWKKFNKMLEGHETKLGKIFFFDYLNSDIDLIRDSDLIKHENKMKSIKSINRMKNDSLYAGVSNGKPHIPNELITRDDAKKQIEELLHRFHLIENLWKGFVNTEISDSQVAFAQKFESAILNILNKDESEK
nr:MAG TPA: abortive infection protein, AbiV family [Caudoviricetes sp.]